MWFVVSVFWDWLGNVHTLIYNDIYILYIIYIYYIIDLSCQISSQLLKASSWNQGETATILKMAKVQSSKFSTWWLRNRTLILWYWYIHPFVGYVSNFVDDKMYHHFVCSHIHSQFFVPLRRHLRSRMEAGQFKGFRGAVPSWPLAVDDSNDICLI